MIRTRAGRRRSHSRTRRPPVRYGTHWAVYTGVALLALGVVVIVAAAVLTR